MNPGRKILTILALTFGAFLSSVAWAAPEKVLNVGLMFKFGEQYDGTVGQMVNGVEAAIAMARKSRPDLKVVVKKYGHDNELSSVFAACEAAAKDKMDAVIGGEDSHHAMVMSEKLGAAGIVFLTPTATNPKVVELSDRSFAMSMSDDQVAVLLANFVVKKVKATNVAVMRGVSSPYTDFLSQQFHLKAAAIDPKLPIREDKFIRGELNFKEVIKAWQKAGVSHVAMLSYESSFVQLWNQSHELGFHPVYIGADGWGDAQVLYEKLFARNVEEANSAVAYQSAYWKQDADHDLARNFRQYYKTTYKSDPNAWAAVAFDGAHVLLRAAANVTKISGNALRDALLKLPTLEVVTSRSFKFNSNRSPSKDLAIYKIDAKGVTFATMVP